MGISTTKAPAGDHIYTFLLPVQKAKRDWVGSHFTPVTVRNIAWAYTMLICSQYYDWGTAYTCLKTNF